MTRTFLALGLSLAIPLAGTIAPLVHAHGDGDTAHHHGQTIHVHLAGHAASHPAGDPAADDGDHDRAVFLQSFVAVAALSFTLPAALPAPFVLAAPAEAPAHRSVLVTHTHDPPFLRSLSARAPPAFLS